MTMIISVHEDSLRNHFSTDSIYFLLYLCGSIWQDSSIINLYYYNASNNSESFTYTIQSTNDLATYIVWFIFITTWKQHLTINKHLSDLSYICISCKNPFLGSTRDPLSPVNTYKAWKQGEFWIKLQSATNCWDIVLIFHFLSFSLCSLFQLRKE